jgi:branched-chain amino acid transport system substrate-binding protein
MQRIVTFVALFSLVVTAVLVASQEAPAPAESPTAAATPAVKASTPGTATPAKATPEPGTSGPAIKIGALVSLTGPYLHEGPGILRGMELALEHYGGQAGGRGIQMVIEDDGTDPTIALDKVRKLVERDKVSIVLVSLFATAGRAVMPYLTEKKIVGIKQAQFPAPLIAQFPYIFVPGGTPKQVTWPMGDYAYNTMKVRRISVMGPDFVTGHEFMDSFTNRFKQLGGEVTQEQWFPVNTVDFAPYLSNIKQADAVAVWVAAAGGPNLVKGYNDYGFFRKMPMITPFISGVLNEDTLPQIGDIALGIPGAIPYASTVDNALNKRVVADWRRKYNARPPYTAINSGYMSVQVALEALNATKGNTDPDRLKEAILKLNVDTPGGPLRLNADRIGVYDVHIVKVAKAGSEYFWQVADTYKDVTPR